MAASLVFRLHDRGPELVREVLLERGWEEYDNRKRAEQDWNLYWRGTTFRTSDYNNLLPWQRLNHHPKTAGITRKDSLVRNLRRMRAAFGSAHYDFSPTTFILPKDHMCFLAEYNKLPQTAGRSVYWICKPVDLSRGRGIFIFADIKDFAYDCSVIVQRYISSPLLISGYKFDLRIYVCVKSFHPLTVYIHQEGLVRFATEKYSLTSLCNLYSHLTNTSINKFGPFYKSEKGKVGRGCKWTMTKFRHFLQSQEINEPLLWQRINNIVTLTLLAIAPSVPSCPNCVELFGFDVLIDSKFKPWLLEVNYSPALTLDCQADISVKTGLVGDLIDLMNYTSADSLRDKAFQNHRCRQSCFKAKQSLEVPLPVLSTLKEHKPKKKKHQKASHTQSKRTNQSRQHVSVADHQRFLLPVADRYRTMRASVSETCTDQTLNWILGPRSEPNVSVVSRKTRPDTGSCQTKKDHQLTEVTIHNNPETEADMELPAEADVSFPTPNAAHRASKSKESAAFQKLPNIHSGRQQPGRICVGGPADPNGQHVPPVRVGGFIRTFPFNAATLKASQHKLDVTLVVQELQKLTGRLASDQSDETKWTNEEQEADGEDCWDSLLWGPKDSQLLSRSLEPK